jgi:superoxide dismutase, Fe-Mn family
MISRREVLAGSVVAAAATCLDFESAEAQSPAVAPPVAASGGTFELPPLPYAFDALEPHLDAQTMQIHHGKHHATYVTKLNEAVAGRAELAGKSVEQLISDLSAVPEAVRTAVRNHGGGHANHTLFWQTMAPKAAPKPLGELAAAVDKTFGSQDKFNEAFTKAALGVFGSGWAWLTLAKDKTLAIETTPNQDSPISAGKQPLFGIDVWEHAYYLKYQNRRPDYVAAWLKLVHWDFVSARYQKLTLG